MFEMDRLRHLKNWIRDIRPSGGRLLNDVLLTVGIISISTLISLLFEHFSFHESNIIILFVLGVLFVSRQTNGYFFGIFASVLCVLAFNYFFTEPKYTFRVYGREYLITFPVMLIVSVITSTLTTKVKRESELSHQGEKRNETLYGISRNLLTANSIDQIVSTTAINISNICSSNVIIYVLNKDSTLSEPYVYSVGNANDIRSLVSEDEKRKASEAISLGAALDSRIYYVPILGRAEAFGVIGVESASKPLTSEQKLLLSAVAAQTALSIEREISNLTQQATRLDMESEKVRSNLLRAVSHDLKTPLTGIVGSSSTLLENWNRIDDGTKTGLVSDIYDDALWLSNCVDNILSITKIDDGRIEIRKSGEPAEEVVVEAVGRIRKYAGNRTIKTELPDELLIVNMDPVLMKQLLVNLLDNAVKFSDDSSEITVRVYRDRVNAVFEVADNGTGIAEKDLPHIFDRFFSVQKGPSKRKGMGLGLAICKSIAIAHGGSIKAMNDIGGGAIFRASIPIGE
jgi:two-component system sensor histidine kinase KdpD